MTSTVQISSPSGPIVPGTTETLVYTASNGSVIANTYTESTELPATYTPPITVAVAPNGYTA